MDRPRPAVHDKRAARSSRAGKLTDPRANEAARVPSARPGPLGGKRDQNRKARTQGLVEAAERLFLEHGIESVTIDDITKEAGVAKGSFYRYFEHKEALVGTLLAPGREAVLAAFDRAERRLSAAKRPAQVKSAYAKLGKELAAALLTRPVITRLYLQEGRAPAVHGRVPLREFEREVAERALRVTEIAFRHDILRRVHAEVSTLAVIGAAERMLHAFFLGELRVDPTVALQDLVAIVIDGMQE